MLAPSALDPEDIASALEEFIDRVGELRDA
jgi:hypothetical protein